MPMVILDMNMPRTCAECELVYESSGGSIVCCRTNKVIELDGRQADCPIQGELDARCVGALLEGQGCS